MSKNVGNSKLVFVIFIQLGTKSQIELVLLQLSLKRVMMKVPLFLVVAVFAPGLFCKPNGNLYSNYDQREYDDNGWNIQESLQTYSAPGQNSVSTQGDISSSVGQIPDTGSLIPNQGPSFGETPNPGSLNPNQGPGFGQTFNPGSLNPNQGSSFGQTPNPGAVNPNQGPGFGQTPGQWPSIPIPGPQGFLPGEFSWGPFKFRVNWNKIPAPRPWDTDPFEKPFPMSDIVSFESPIPLPAPRPWNTDPFEQSFPLPTIPAFNFTAPLNDYQNYNMRATYSKNYDGTELEGPPGSSYNTNVVVGHHRSHEQYGY